ncbi:nicotinamide riboside transporter PnuC [Rhizorhabdus dicambivorans]|uniref:Nicotinamide riboside transporter PnuC n=1 Tax=Rhizorhabdus dicambivorans TaxID=1850238 RepID=A0A2A4FZ91_9SPHN|nr:nicotinamide riboside transporter PnuC [Rhizorhabdus dicambivorans]ATE65934.1 nicotinamide riboside transporter PnuC [Rhizorhabdus dicambivorans]PCE43050.1 nicotinamide riboside transporter PnuC [Rhizorhabdus dicambivorans]
MNLLEIAANAFATASILLAARNSIHGWWTSIIGCTLFAVLFYDARLYADVTLQFFFIGISATGWWMWLRGNAGAPLPIRHAPPALLPAMGFAGLVVGLGYGALLHRFTNAYAPFVDSSVLVLSVIGQLLLMRRMIENWYIWLAVNMISVPLYLSRDLQLTAFLYACYLASNIYGLWVWRREMHRAGATVPA